MAGAGCWARAPRPPSPREDTARRPGGRADGSCCFGADTGQPWLPRRRRACAWPGTRVEGHRKDGMVAASQVKRSPGGSGRAPLAGRRSPGDHRARARTGVVAGGRAKQGRPHRHRGVADDTATGADERPRASPARMPDHPPGGRTRDPSHGPPAEWAALPRRTGGARGLKARPRGVSARRPRPPPTAWSGSSRGPDRVRPGAPRGHHASRGMRPGLRRVPAEKPHLLQR